MKKQAEDGIGTDSGPAKRLSPLKWGLGLGLLAGPACFLLVYVLTDGDLAAAVCMGLFGLVAAGGCGAGCAASTNGGQDWTLTAEGEFDRVEYVSRTHSVPDTAIYFRDGRVVITGEYFRFFPHPSGTVIRVEQNGRGEIRVTEAGKPRS